MLNKIVTNIFVLLLCTLATKNIFSQEFTSKTDFSDLEFESYSIIKYHCGDCHIPGSKFSKKSALDVFKLTGLDWYKSMSISQKVESIARLESNLNSTESELKENFLANRVKPRKPTKHEIDTYKKFINETMNPLKF